VCDEKVAARVVLAGFFTWFSTFTSTLHDNGDGPTFVSAEAMLNCNRRGSTYRRAVAAVLWSIHEWVKKDRVRRMSL